MVYCSFSYQDYLQVVPRPALPYATWKLPFGKFCKMKEVDEAAPGSRIQTDDFNL
jgi:hypothetical protein